MYILFLYISSIYEKSKQSSFLGSPKPRMDWIVSASANEMKASPLPNASPILNAKRIRCSSPSLCLFPLC